MYFKEGKTDKYLKNTEGKDIMYWNDRHLIIE